jgi:hypothetical protein
VDHSGNSAAGPLAADYPHTRHLHQSEPSSFYINQSEPKHLLHLDESKPGINNNRDQPEPLDNINDNQSKTRINVHPGQPEPGYYFCVDQSEPGDYIHVNQSEPGNHLYGDESESTRLLLHAGGQHKFRQQQHILCCWQCDDDINIVFAIFVAGANPLHGEQPMVRMVHVILSTC